MILNNPSNCGDIISKISKLAEILGDYEYSEKIKDLSNDVKKVFKRDQFLASVRNSGLYFEAPNFSSFNMSQLETTIFNEFNVKVNEPVIIKRDLLILLKDYFSNSGLNIDLPIPKADTIILNDIFVAPIYVLKLKQEADSRLTSRDFGAYNAINKQPKQGRGRDGTLAQGSKLGQMEFDGLLGHNCITTIRELRTVKNDVQSMKFDLANQILSTGTYNLPNVKKTSTIKLIIDGLIDFLNS